MGRVPLLAFLLLSMAPNKAGVNAAGLRKEGRIPSRLTLDKLVQKGLAEGEKASYPPVVAKNLGVSPDLKIQRLAVPRSQNLDGCSRVFEVLTGPSTTTVQARHLIFGKFQKDATRGEISSLSLRLTPQGKLERALLSKGIIGPDGKTVRGSGLGNIRDLEIKSPETRLLLQVELDFWLKGEGRSHVDAASGNTP